MRQGTGRPSNGGNGRYVPEHYVVMEKIIGHPVKKGERIHHRNGIKDDNRPDNLYLCASESEHQRLEALISQFAKQLMWGTDLQLPNEKLIEDFLLYCKERGYNISV